MKQEATKSENMGSELWNKMKMEDYIVSINNSNRKKNNIANMTDEELVELYISENNESAFEEIINRYADRIYSIALRITNDHHGSEEVLQEVFLTLTKKIDTFQAKSKFSTWLYRVTVNASYTHLRAEKKHESDISLENYAPYDENGTLMGKIKYKDWGNSPDIILFQKEAIDIIEKAVSELPEKHRIVLHLRDIDDLSNEEISEILGISEGAVKSRLHRARLFLRDKISDYFYEWRK
ncbi:sigma-70 family RNA polymerase sigma factor [Desulfobacterota bacterium AH_259_B03_O07]|nr:sigma-70 family RNA polymerase sigma factor [Desulfobacterota bacterium AH_259_B03_O07]